MRPSVHSVRCLLDRHRRCLALDLPAITRWDREACAGLLRAVEITDSATSAPATPRSLVLTTTNDLRPG